MAVARTVSESEHLKIMADDMEVQDGGLTQINSAVKEVISNGMVVSGNGDGRMVVEDSFPVQGIMRMNGSDEDLKPVLVTGNGSLSLAGEEKSSDSGILQNRAAVENAVATPTEDGDKVGLSVAELVAKARAPVKSEFLITAPVRMLVPNGTVTGTRSNNGVWDDRRESRVSSEKKSKRQMKRERLQAKKSTEGICAAVARTGDVKQCPYAENCRFNHDLESYRAQKPPDLPGECPSLESGERCSYGIACRYAGTHKECDGSEIVQQRRSNSAANERNSLNKELQKLLWKNMGSYPKADAQLQAMGLMNKAFKMRKVDGESNQMQEAAHSEIGKAQERDEGVKSEVDETMNESALETGSTAPVDGTFATENGAGEGMVGVVCETLIVTTESVEPILPVLSHTTDGSFSPQKRLRSEADETIEDNPANDFSPGDRQGGRSVDISTKLDEDQFLSNTLGGAAGDISCEIENGKSTHTKDDWRSLFVESKFGAREKKIIDFRGKLYLAPLTTVGNLPFRRVCKGLGADITCGEMAMCTNLLQGQASEWALLRRHSCEDLFGVQICGSFPDHVARTAELIEQECAVDFIDINMGCPIDLVVSKGSGSCLLTKPQRLEQLVRVTSAVMENPLTVKMRMGYYEGRNCAHALMPNLHKWGVSAVTIHGRTRQQRYSKQADWAYIQECVDAAKGNLQVIGNGDVFSYTDWDEHLNNSDSKLSTCMIARGALIKPWLFREIKERRHWDISSGERLDILRQYVHCGLAHWGSDSKGVETTRHFLLEWLSYMHRYIPVGLLEVIPQRLNWRPPSYFGRNDLETMMASESAADWVRISELLLGPTPANFVFNPKHKSNAYDKAENG